MGGREGCGDVEEEACVRGLAGGHLERECQAVAKWQMVEMMNGEMVVHVGGGIMVLTEFIDAYHVLT